MQIEAIAVHSITGVIATHDGMHGLIKLKTDGQEMALAFPFKKLVPLMESLSQVFGECARIQKLDKKTKHVLPCEWWEIGPSPDG